MVPEPAAAARVRISVLFCRVRAEPYPGDFPGDNPSRNFCKFCTTFIPVPETAVKVRPWHNTRSTGTVYYSGHGYSTPV